MKRHCLRVSGPVQKNLGWHFSVVIASKMLMKSERGSGWCNEHMDRQNSFQIGFEEKLAKVFNHFALVLARNHDESAVKYLFWFNVGMKDMHYRSSVRLFLKEDAVLALVIC